MDNTPDSKVPRYKYKSHHALRKIREATTWQAKQQAIDSYMDKKIESKASPDQNIAVLAKKMQDLCQHLSMSDVEQVEARRSFYCQCMAGLCNQKALIEGTVGDSRKAAKVALKAEREVDPQNAIQVVLQYIEAHHYGAQGPNACIGAINECRSDVEQALAFPKPQEWDGQLDAFMQQKLCGTSIKPPGKMVQAVADELNALQMHNVAQQHAVSRIADKYFYDKIVTAWNVGGNQGHIQDRLQTLLPLLQHDGVKQQVSAQAVMFQQSMAVHRAKKLQAEESAAAKRARQRRSGGSCDDGADWSVLFS